MKSLTQCKICRINEDLPFRCSYCKEYCCADHRLPENHDCEQIWMTTLMSKRRNILPEIRKSFSPSRNYHESNNRSRSRSPGDIRFGRTETFHLLAGTVLVMLVGLTFRPLSVLFELPTWTIIVLAISLAASFILHELAHKFSAQIYGLWAEFRLTPMGAILTLMSAIPFAFLKIIAPGAVMILGTSDTKTIGKVAFVGPLTNVILSTGIYLTLLLLQFSNALTFEAKTILSWVAEINAFIALFNLLPFAIFDGQKIFSWNKGIWISITGASLLLLILNYIVF